MSDDHRETAARWHGGQSSPLYAYASTGAVAPGILREIWDCVEIVERGELDVDADPVDEHERLMALLRHVEPDVATGKAREVGRDHGENLAAWWQQDALVGGAAGDTVATARRTLQGIDDGDPAILDTLPSYVHGYTATDLQADCDWHEPDLDDREAHRRWDAVLSELWSEYEIALHDAVRESVIRSCQREVANDGMTPDVLARIDAGGGKLERPTTASAESPYTRPVAGSPMDAPQTQAVPTPPGWIAERIGPRDGHEVEVVYDPRRFEVAVTSTSGTEEAALEAGGWEHQAAAGHLRLWTRDRTAAARAALALHDRRVAGSEAPAIGRPADQLDAGRSLDV